MYIDVSRYIVYTQSCDIMLFNIIRKVLECINKFYIGLVSLVNSKSNLSTSSTKGQTD